MKTCCFTVPKANSKLIIFGLMAEEICQCVMYEQLREFFSSGAVLCLGSLRTGLGSVDLFRFLPLHS